MSGRGPRLAARFPRRAHFAAVPLRGGRGVPCAAARAIRAACDRRVHARRPLPAPSSAYQARVLRSVWRLAGVPSAARKSCQHRNSGIGCAAAIARWRVRHLHRQGKPGVWNGASPFVNLVRTAGFRTIGASAGHRDGTKQASREILRPSLRDYWALHVRALR